METLLVKINETGKASILAEMLKSMDFVSSVDYFDDLKKMRKLFEDVNQSASQTELPEMTMDEIIQEIKNYRLEKEFDRR
ncbi:MAG: hypothetical protein LBE36_11010 [Flavobacteriaceae bacterium]|jgi:hypothetical protein|nr:hypothetical protein [Flavobacteriaceae bacterium]